MCGRYTLSTGAEDLAAHFALLTRPVLEARYNIAPQQPVLVVRASGEDGGRRADHLLWGLVPRWAKDPSIGQRMINARSETAAEKPAYRGAMKYRRCLIPADGFYEWAREGKVKQPYLFRVKDQPTFGFAGLWEHWQDAEGNELETCTILTTEANDLVGEIHERMPVILPPDRYDAWLDVKQEDGAVAAELLEPFEAERMTMTPVSRRVNSPREDEAALVDPIDPAAGTLFGG